ncbi:hypothetical protein GH714_006052 [Hevea brasiliensis]|uniref:Alkaline/neutral invertase n=1 Tax=Hevea brasiliensis TaxID=3981 RepID=A0A6A6N0H6_HEVBR|nr:hypothetical protein GH714_006052 [Hevea brasiliensis]
MFNCSSFLQNRIGIHRLKRTRDYGLFGNSTVDRLQLLTCKCQQAESVGGLTADDGNGTWFVDSSRALHLNGVINPPNVLEFEDVQQLKQENGDLTSNGAVKQENESFPTTEEVLDPDFGEAAIGRVAPVDSGLWWIILLRAYGKCSGDLSILERIDVQTGIKMILRLCLADGFDMFPTLLVTDGSCMIDRRMGIHGHPLEIQALFYSALLCAREMLAPEDGSADLIRALNNRLVALSFHIREYYWIDLRKLNEIYRYKTEEYSYDAVNKFNIYPDQISPWLVEWMPNQGGYLIGNLQPAHMDFRFFSLGNLWSVVSGLATIDQSHAILDLIEAKWTDLVAGMPLKICYPALEGQEWQIITGSDPKNTPWSYHNAGSWPTLLWQLTVAGIKMNRPEIAARAVEVAERCISRDKWPEYYDTKRARFIGKQARLFQTWSIAGYLVAKLLLADPSAAKMLITEEDPELVNAFSCMISANPRRKRGRKN